MSATHACIGFALLASLVGCAAGPARHPIASVDPTIAAQLHARLPSLDAPPGTTQFAFDASQPPRRVQTGTRATRLPFDRVTRAAHLPLVASR